MNTTITTILTTTKNDKVREIAAKIIAMGNSRIRAKFVKDDGSVRDMVFCVRDNWNAMNGIEHSTYEGRKMVATKVMNDKATVTEFLADGTFRPRTINLASVIEIDRV